MRLAALRAQQGDEAALQQLEKLTQASNKTEAHLALISAALQRKNLAMALDAARALDKLDPKSPIPKDLEARVLMGLGNFKEARGSFSEAIARDGSYFASVAGLNEIDRRDGKLKEALARTSSWSSSHPGHAISRLAVVELESLLGATADETTKALERAVTEIPSDALLRAALISQLVSRKQFERALGAANAAVADLPGSPRLLALQGEAFLSMGDQQRAISTFRKLEAISPDDPTPHFSMADLHARAGAWDLAEKSLRRAAEASPTSPEALKRLYKLNANRRSWDQVLAVARELQSRFPQTAVGLLAEADGLMAKGRRKEAIAALNKADGMPDAGDVGWQLFIATGQEAGASAADRFAEDRMRKQPGDFNFMFLVGTHYFSQGNNEAAERVYERLIAAEPMHAPALNNIALLRLEKGDLEGAQKASGAAVRATPNTATYWDTHAAVLVAAKRFDEGIAAARKATVLDKNPAFQLTLAHSLHTAGKRQEAADALQPLIALGKKFPKSDEVARLAKLVKS